MVLRSMIIGAMFLLGLVASNCSTPADIRKVSVEPEREFIDEAKPAWLGCLVHRSRVYRLEDLLDPHYRAASDDPFAREFEPDHVYADWAGL